MPVLPQHNNCMVCSCQLAPDDYDGICTSCDVDLSECQECGGTGFIDTGGVNEAGNPIILPCLSCNDISTKKS